VGLGQLADHLPSELSGGKNAKGWLFARLMQLSPSATLADEPTWGLG